MNSHNDRNYSNQHYGGDASENLFHAYFPGCGLPPTTVTSSFSTPQAMEEIEEAPPAATPNVVFLEKPRKCLTAYNFFFKDKREQIMQARKDAGENKIGFAGMAKAVSKEWKKIDPELKAYYDDLAAKDKARYSKDLIKWRSMKKAALNGDHPSNKKGATAASARGRSDTLPRNKDKDNDKDTIPGSPGLYPNANSLQALQTNHHENSIMAPARRISTASADEAIFFRPLQAQGTTMTPPTLYHHQQVHPSFDHMDDASTTNAFALEQDDEQQQEVPMYVNVRGRNDFYSSSSTTEPVPLMESHDHDCNQSIMRLMNEHASSSLPSFDGLVQTMGPECHELFLSLFRDN